jgi:hypothetical protein
MRLVSDVGRLYSHALSSQMDLDNLWSNFDHVQ